ncbi:MAG: ECF transporter S component [Clostridia bacterium]|nr:ECF transporter S component [Clostridia bacterium]MBR2296718.1 ECF transporter S component [Clostridia bacterium]
MKSNTRKIVMIGMLSALAFVLTCLGNLIPIKVAGFLDYDPKDIIIVIAGFILGPISAIIITIITALLELVTISTTGIIGFVMNVISSAFFAVTASLIYQKKRTLSGAIIGLICGVVAMCLAMMLWNYLITPLYMAGTSREMIAKMLPTVFLPFNLVKGSANAALAMLLYKPVVNAMRRARLLDKIESKKSETKALLIIACAVIVVICVLSFLVLGGVI